MNKVKGVGSPVKSPQHEASPQSQAQPPPPPRQTTQEVSLIDFQDEPPSAQLANLCKFGNREDEF